MRAAVRRVAVTAFEISLVLATTQAGAQTPPAKPFSGTIEPGNGHVLTYSLTGVEPVPAGQPSLEGYDGVVSDRATVAFSGQMQFSLPEGLVTNLGMSASLSGVGIESQTVSWVDPTPEDGRFAGPDTATLPFNLTAEVVLPPPPSEDAFASPTAEGQIVPLGAITASASTSNCNDVGVCGGAAITFSIAVVPGGDEGGLSLGIIAVLGGAALVVAATLG
ncbi:MAG: hypothetical protein HY658_04605, partial [Actinobacteria bacterium]|nr:hypothetical protein [Actinomycetota bacterium]